MKKITTISKEFTFDAAHNLVNYKGKCENLHGHTYRLRVTLMGTVDEKSGMIMDFGDLKSIVKERVVDRLDHNYLNNISPLSTAENIIHWIWNEIEAPLKAENRRLYEIVLWETATSFITLRAE